MDVLLKIMSRLPKKATDPDQLMKAAFSIRLSRKWLVRIRQHIREVENIPERESEKEVEFLPFVVSINKMDEFKKTVIVDDYIPAFEYYR